jgi:hypothetical protein
MVAVIIGGGLILSGITGLTALRDSGGVNPPVHRKIGLWTSIVLGALLIVLGSAGSAILLGVVLGAASISTGLQHWRLVAQALDHLPDRYLPKLRESRFLADYDKSDLLAHTI